MKKFLLTFAVIAVFSVLIAVTAYSIFASGDIDGDGEVTTEDYIYVRLLSDGHLPPNMLEKEQRYAANIDGDGFITEDDWKRVRNHVVFDVPLDENGSKGLEYISNGDGTCYVSGIGSCTDSDIVIPHVSPAGDLVTSVGYFAFHNCMELISVVIPDSVTSIGDFAFSYCTGLKSVSISNGVTSIGWYAFDSCSALTSIYIPESVIEICYAALSECDSLTSIIVDPRNPVYYSKDNCIIERSNETLALGCNNSVIPTDGSIKRIGDYAFHGCNGITSMTIPNSVTSIGEDAFCHCTDLTSIVIPDSVTFIGARAFEYCCKLESIVIPDSVTEIDRGMFHLCGNLKSIVIPKSVTYIFLNSFFGCESLTDVYYAGSEEEWNVIEFDAVDDDGSLTNATVWFYASPDIMKKSEGLEYTSNGDGTCFVSGIGNCYDTDIIIPYVSPSGDRVTEIGANAFYECSEITSVLIPGSVKSIGDYAFFGCLGMSAVIIPESVVSVGESAFEMCWKIKSMVIPGSLTDIGYGAFCNCDFDSLKVKDGNPVYHSAGDCIIETSTGTLVCGSNNSVIPADGSVKSIGDYAFGGRSGLQTIIFPESIGSIGEGAFESCAGLRSITIPSTVTNIGMGAFASGGIIEIRVEDGNPVYHSTGNCVIETATRTLVCGSNNSVIPVDGSVESIGALAFAVTDVTSVVIPDSVTYIGIGAFGFCSNLTSVVIPDSVTYIGSEAFAYCFGLTSIDIPDGVTEIGDHTFDWCRSLTSVVIPDSVTEIGWYAFANCSSLKDIYYSGTSIQWRNISIDYDNDCLKNAEIHFNS